MKFLAIIVLALVLAACGTTAIYTTRLQSVNGDMLTFENGLVVRATGKVDVAVGKSYSIYKLKDRWNAVVEKGTVKS